MILSDRDYKTLLDAEALARRHDKPETARMIREWIQEENEGDREGEEAYAEHTAPY